MRPIIKWAGGKKYLINDISEILKDFQCHDYHYCEPMVGGGAIYFAFANKFANATISDINPELINLYKVVKNNVDSLIEELTNGQYFYMHKSDPKTKENYYRIRASEPVDTIKKAARTIYLLKTCFNGLMRTNKKGKFNVPPGSYKNPIICDKQTLKEASKTLQTTTIAGPQDANHIIRNINQKTLLFVDPPYHADTTKFTSYSGEFTPEDQIRLINTLIKSNCPYIYTNRATELIKSQFNNATLKEINLRHSIQPKYTTGVVEKELIAYNLEKT